MSVAPLAAARPDPSFRGRLGLDSRSGHYRRAAAGTASTSPPPTPTVSGSPSPTASSASTRSVR